MITQKRLKELLNYDPQTGIFIWKVTMGKAVKGAKAGKSDKDGYIRIGIDKKSYGAHRLVWLYMTGKFPKNHIDHKNQIKFDNKWHNLKDVTPSQNMKNKNLIASNTSGVTGVYKRKNKWESSIFHKKHIYLGRFFNFDDAVIARYNAEIKYNIIKYNKNTPAKKYLEENNLI